MNNPDRQLDEQLKTVLRREEPSPDFTARVLARVQANSEPRNQRRPFDFLAFVRSPLAGWVAAAAAACLLVVIAAVVYRNFGAHKTVGAVAALTEPARPSAARADQHAGPAEPTITVEPAHAQAGRRRVHSARVSHTQDQLAIAGERAKQQLELGLFIASSKLNLAERAVSRANDQDEQRRNAEPEELRMER